ncbi:hypothetical protein M409DRAFT_59620 [Zasmidium cellare ATCC 36951]|uniref:USP domain-containing protein n=1 Tax=Zasmidium cellare ATCC 36951 TaxID=1080233 RepID=A0A6A6C1D3_ZASCE|nr:uncharacterized protein M409DRAFT_59620 [Zasmidium cellare ATCC 36951]KAF2160831.1 hypothetical protein M409DRAFT_59620 [Zasmidium cellare ATCC 36951]
MAVSTRSQGGKLYIPAPDRKRTRRRTCPAPAPTPAPALLQAAPPAAPPAQSPARSPKPRKNYVDKGVTADLSPRKAKSPKTKTPPPPGGISKNYADKGVTADLSPRKTKNPKAETPPPAGGISKIGAGSKQKTPPPSPVDPLLVKRRGRLVNNNLQVIPAHVLDGRPVKRFPQVQFPVTKGLWNKGELCYRNATLQALFHTPAFYRYLGKMHKDCRDGPTTKCVVCTLQWLAQAYYNDQVSIRPYGNSTTRVAGPLDPLRLFNQTCKRNPPTDEVTLGDMIEEFAAESQSDAWNFIQYLMGLIRDKELPTDDATFSHMFDMPSEQSWTCQQCGETFTREAVPRRSVQTFGHGRLGRATAQSDKENHADARGPSDPTPDVHP